MKVTIRFFGVFRSLTGKEKITIELGDEAPLKKAIKVIVGDIPKLKRTLIDQELEDPRPNTLIIINGKEISVLNDLETMLRDGDDVVLIPVLHAG